MSERWPEFDPDEPQDGDERDDGEELGPCDREDERLAAGGRLDDEDAPGRWPLDWRGLYPRERWLWFEQLWEDVLALRERYRLPVRSAWWEDAVQVEALAALAAWVQRYDSGEWDDPPGKLALLYDLERIGVLLRDGNEPLHPGRDRRAFERHLLELGCQPPGDERRSPR
jgi:hypothetical protein